jgi:hypothetical protein
MSVYGINGTPARLTTQVGGAGIARTDGQRIGTAQPQPAARTPHPAAPQPAPRGQQPAAAAEPPAGTDPELWSVLSAEERAFFARVGAMGPLTYGRMMQAQPAVPAPRGGRLDVRA